MCGCDHHFDGNAPCTCSCPGHEHVRRHQAELAAFDARTPTTQERLAAISEWIDNSPGYAGISTETHIRRRVGKLAEETGEVFEALGGLFGENPRKGRTHNLDDVIKELLDAAASALGAVEHLTGNRGAALELLDEHIGRVAERAGVSS